MAKLFANKKHELKKIELSFETVYLKEVSFRHVPMLEKVSDPNINAMEKVILFTQILKEVLVDKDGNEYEDFKDMTAEEAGDMFSIEDFGTLIQAMLPAPADGDEPAGKN